MNERFDSKLILLRMIRKWYVVLIWMVAVALLTGVPYYVIKVFLAKPDYSSRTTYHVTYAEDSSGKAYDYINEFTWDEWAHTDLFIDEVMNNLTIDISKDEVKGYISATLLSDARLAEIDVVTKDIDLTKKIAAAVRIATHVFKDNLAEIRDGDVVLFESEPNEVYRDVRVPNAFLLGAFIGLIVAVFGMLILYILDDSIYIPLLFTERYGIYMVTDEEALSKDLYKGIDRIVIRDGEPVYPEEFKKPEAVLEILYGAHNGRMILQSIYEAEEYGISIKGAILTDPDTRLINAYMMPYKRRNKVKKG